MRLLTCACVMLLLLGGVRAAAQSGGEKSSSTDQYLGTWTGTWEGAGGSGGFELTLSRETAGALSGKVSVTGEPTYDAVLKAVSFDGNKMTAKYDFPPSEGIEVVLTATFDNNAATGAWSAREGASGNEVAAGTWAVKKKQA